MKTELLDPFIKATISVLTTMCQTEVTAGTPRTKEDLTTWGNVTGIIGIASDTITGSMAISFDNASILTIVSKMFMEEFTEVNNEVIDAVGEITNIITGTAKRELSEMGLKCNMSTPLMLVGKGVLVNQHTKAPILQVPFEIAAGKFVIEITFTEQNIS